MYQFNVQPVFHMEHIYPNQLPALVFRSYLDLHTQGFNLEMNKEIYNCMPLDEL